MHNHCEWAVKAGREEKENRTRKYSLAKSAGRHLVRRWAAAALAALSCLSLMSAGSVFADNSEAAAGIPAGTDTAVLRVKGIEDTADGVSVNAYQIATQTYNDYGASGMKELDGVGIADLNKPTAEEVKKLAAEIRKGSDGVSTKFPAIPLERDENSLNAADHTVDYVHSDTKAGMYLVLANGAEYLYNPMIVSLTYSDAGNAASLGKDKDGTDVSSVDANGTFFNDAWIKRQKKPVFDKSIVTKTSAGAETLVKAEDLEVNASKNGDYPTVTFRITAAVPKYSDQYKQLTFSISDKPDPGFDAPDLTAVRVTGIANPSDDELSKPEEKKADETVLERDQDYTIKAVGNGFQIDLSGTCLVSNKVGILHIEYSVKMNAKTTYNETANVNESTLRYSHSVDDDSTKELKSKTRVYSFEINAGTDRELTKNKKVRKTDGTVSAGADLEGAEFLLFKANEKWEEEGSALAQAASEKDGRIHFSGLAGGKYLLKETKAPAGYLMSSTVYHILIDPVIEDGKLISYRLNITGDDDEDKALDCTYKITYTEKDDDQVSRSSAAEAFSVKDAPIGGLVSTGGRGIGIISALAVALIAMAVLMLRKNEAGDAHDIVEKS